MRRFLLGTMALGMIVILAGTARAHDPFQRRHHHARFHDQLRLGEFQRQLAHRQAHRHPMTRHQHHRLHDSLELDRFLDRLDHREYHRHLRSRPSFGHGTYHGYGPVYGLGPGVRSGTVYPTHRYYHGAPGLGLGGRNFSLWIGY